MKRINKESSIILQTLSFILFLCNDCLKSWLPFSLREFGEAALWNAGLEPSGRWMEWVKGGQRTKLSLLPPHCQPTTATTDPGSLGIKRKKKKKKRTLESVSQGSCVSQARMPSTKASILKAEKLLHWGKRIQFWGWWNWKSPYFYDLQQINSFQ